MRHNSIFLLLVFSIGPQAYASPESTQLTLALKLQRPSQSQPPAPDAALPEGWFAPLSAEQLLATPLRQSCLQQLRQLTPLPDTLFDSWILTAIHRFAALVQLLPASQSHHHSIPGGLLDHSLEVACNAIRLRQGYLLPPEAGAEEQARQASAWTVAVVCAALLHDTGKIAVDMEIHQHHRRSGSRLAAPAWRSQRTGKQ